MNTRLLRRIIGFLLTALLLTATLIFSSTAVTAQNRTQRRVVVIRPFRPFRPFRPLHPYDSFRSPYERFNQFGYNQYVFNNSEKAYNQGYKDGRKTGEKDS